MAPGRRVRALPPPHPEASGLGGFEELGPRSAKPALTEDDDEPHDEGQGGEDQAPIADGLVVWKERPGRWDG